MKKQLLIAAVAATMTSVAIADISITGKMKVNYKDSDIGTTLTNAISSEANLFVTGTTGASKFYMELDNASGAAGTIAVEDIWMSTDVMGVAVKAGTWNGSDTILNKDTARAAGKYSLSTTVSGVALTLTGSSNQSNATFKVAGDVAGVAVSYATKDAKDNFTASGTFEGITIAYENENSTTANADMNSIAVSGSYAGFDLTYAQATTESLAIVDGSNALGNAAKVGGVAGVAMGAGDDISGFVIATTLAGQAVKAKIVTVDATNDVDFFELTVTHALPAGATLELTYSDVDVAGSTASDATIFDVELMVAF